MGRANFGGIVKQVCLEYIPDAAAGDYVLVHAGFALSKVDQEESAIPITEEVRGACEILGFDPLYIANEGKLIAIVREEGADAVLEAIQGHPLGRQAAVIGEVTAEHSSFATMRTRVGSNRVVDMLSSEQLPRIC